MKLQYNENNIPYFNTRWLLQIFIIVKPLTVLDSTLIKTFDRTRNLLKGIMKGLNFQILVL